jgi:hypothetical protein
MMSGAGETRNKGLELVSGDAAEGFAPADPTVRLYWKKGMVWTVYRTHANAGHGRRSIFRRMALRFQRGRKRLIKFLMQPWP